MRKGTGSRSVTPSTDSECRLIETAPFRRHRVPEEDGALTGNWRDAGSIDHCAAPAGLSGRVGAICPNSVLASYNALM